MMLLMLDRVFVLLCWALVMRLSAGAYSFFNVGRSWDEARKFCQDCATDLVTGTPGGISDVSRSSSSTYWIGLRRKLTSSSNVSSTNGTMNSSSNPWSHWANGDPLTFQKWSPGWPVLDPASPNYTEDSCVAMLRFEVWVEKNCSEPLPFICSDDGFPGKVSVTNITSNSATVTWPPASGLISHYDVDLNSKRILSIYTDLTADLVNLTSGTDYKVKVYALKCWRHIYMELSTFYTIPEPVSDLTLTAGHNHINADWTLPEGGYSSFTVDLLLDGEAVETAHGLTEPMTTFVGVNPENSYTVKVQVVSGNQTSETVSSSIFTLPFPPSDVRTAAVDKDMITFEWTAPEKFTRATYGVKISSVVWGHSWSATVYNKTNHTFYNLKSASKYDFEVYAIGFRGNSDSTYFSAYTVPLPPSDVRVTAVDKDMITFEWTAPENFTRATYGVNISSSFWGHSWSATVYNRTNHTFSNLKSGSKYSFEVYAMGIGGNSSTTVFSSYTETVEREISLSMLCSSQLPLHCDASSTREEVFKQLQAHFQEVLGDDIIWSLEKKDPKDKTKR